MGTSPRWRLPPIRTLAVFRALQLGDMLCAVPALRALRAAFPGARISLIGLPWAQEYVRRFSAYVDDFIPFPGHPDLPEQGAGQELLPKFFHAVRSRRYDLALQMHGDGSVSNAIVGAFGARRMAGWSPAGAAAPPLDFPVAYRQAGPEPLRLLRLLGDLGVAEQGEHLEFPLTADDWTELAAKGLAHLASRSYICIHAGARSRAKCWPAHCFAAVADALADEFMLTVVLTGSAMEADLAAAVASRMRHSAVDTTAEGLSVGAMAALMSKARLLVCNDTGVSHIAAGLGLPSVVLFHQADMERWAPLCKERHRCIRDLEGRRGDQVLAAARALLA